MTRKTKEQVFGVVDKYIEGHNSSDLDKLRDKLADVNIRLREELNFLQLLAHRIDDIWTSIK